MRRLATTVLVLAALLPAPSVHARRKNSDQLLRVVAPVARGNAPAHPFVNVIVRFGTAADGTPADASTFRARVGKTPLAMTPIVENGVQVGMRGTIAPELLRLGPRRANRLRLEVRTAPTASKPKGIRDVDRVRFRAIDTPNEPPVALLAAGQDVIFPDIGTPLDGAESHDPESDALTYSWDFGDGTTAAEATPAPHVYPEGTGDVTVRLTVSDGQTSSTAETKLTGCPALEVGKTPGHLQLASTEALEFGASTTPVTRRFTVSNTAGPGTQVHVRIGIEGSAFTADPSDLVLDSAESAFVTVTFTPGAGGHQKGDLALVACAENRSVVHLLAHGYAGAAPDNGPTFAAEPAFFNLFGVGVSMLLPNGDRVPANNTVYGCTGTNDACLTDADCAANGGTCNLAVTQLLDPNDLCADGTGGLYILSDEGTFTDPTPDSDTETSVTILRLQYDATGNRTDAAIVGRTTSGTLQIACDGVAAADGGRLFTAEGRSVTLDPNCFRDELEQLVVTRKSNGSSPPPLMTRIDAVAGQDLCNGDLDPVANLEVTRDGAAVFASLSDTGLYQLRPAARFLTPDITGGFQVHPDGDLLYVTANDNGTTGLVQLYKFSPDLAANGAFRLADLTPCATFTLPNNRVAGSIPRTTFLGEHSFAGGRRASGSLDATVLVSFFSTGGVLASQGQLAVLPRQLRIQGMVAFSTPAGSSSCDVLGLINLDLVDQLAF